MSNHPTIAALKERLESERDLAYLDWLFPIKFNISNRDEVIKTHQYKRRLDYETYIVGHEAATERLMGVIEKAVELLQEINIDNPSFEDSRIEWMEIQIDKTHAQEIREFLSTLADAGEAKKEDK